MSDTEEILGQIQAFSSFVFCYMCHQLVFPLVNDLKNPTDRRMTKVFRRVHISEITGNIMVGIAGYLLLLEHIHHIPINAMVLASIQTIPISVGKFLMVISLFLSIPLNMFPARQVVFQSFGFEKTNKNHIIVSLVMTFVGTLVAITFQNINSYFGLMGGTAGVMMAGTIPTICYFKLVGLKSWQEKVMGIFMLIVTLLGVTGAILSVIYM